MSGGGVRQANMLDFQSRDSGSNPAPSHQSPDYRLPAKFLIPTKPIVTELPNIVLEVSRGKNIERLKRLFRKYHYLPRHNLVGRQIYIKVMEPENYQVVSALSFSNPIALSLGSRDKWIGWNLEQRLKNINHKVMHEARFLVLPHIKVPNLASRILSKSCKLARKEWKAKYGDNAVLVESFVDSRYYEGICYQAANFIYLGKTKGYAAVPTGKRTSQWAENLYGDEAVRVYQTLQPIGFPKLMYYLPLHRYWRRELLR